MSGAACNSGGERRANRRVGAPKRGHERGKSAPLCVCKGGVCASRAACEQKGGAHRFRTPRPVNRLRKNSM